MPLGEGRIVVCKGFMGDDIYFSDTPIDFKHFTCTPPTIDKRSRLIIMGADAAEIRHQMRTRACRYAGSIADMQAHDHRVRDPHAAAAFFVWANNEAPVRLGLSPCCGCGTPTPIRCECGRAWLCGECAEHHVFQHLVIGGPMIFPKGRCRACLCEAQRRAGLRR